MKPLRLLLLDGDSDRRKELVAVLRGAEHQVMAPVDAAAAADALAAPDFDALLLDLALPELDLGALRRAIAPAETAEPDSLEDAERRHLELVLRYTSGNKRKAAHLLGISRSTLQNKVRKYRLEET
jgi:DNA-binding NtrC family response regulator